MTTYREAAAVILNGKKKGIETRQLETESKLIDEYELSSVMGPFLYVRVGAKYWEIMTHTDSDGRPRATMGDLIGNYLGDLQAAIYNICEVVTRVLVQCRGVHWNDPRGHKV